MRTSADYPLVKRTAKELLSQFGLSEPPIDPVSIADSLGVRVKFASFSGEFEGVSGFYDPSEEAIYVNKDEFPLRQTFTIAHELGHHLLHKEWANSEEYKMFWRDMNRNADDFHEREANAFAAHLLVPRVMLDRYYPRLSKPDLSKLFAVSTPVITNRLSTEYGV
jgi:Zn-dependent peptidase ImmA (M78 family)